MKRVLLILIISLLFVSGCGAVLADTLCPHKQARRAHQRVEVVIEHGQRSSCHAEMASDELKPADTLSTEEQEQRASFEGQTGPCTHCITSPETQINLFVLTRGTELSKRDAGAAVLLPSGFLSPFAASFAPPVQARQHAPPGINPRRHLLLSVFLI